MDKGDTIKVHSWRKDLISPDPFRFRSGFYGLFLADIIGSYFEHSSASHRIYPDINRLKHGGNVFGIPFGYTDDTILALHSAEALLESDGLYRPLLHLLHYVRYLNDQSAWSPTGKCFDIGLTTKKSLRDPNWIGRFEDANSGNGVLMKMLPFSWHAAQAEPCDLTGQCPDFFASVAGITHGSVPSVRTAQVYGQIQIELLRGASWEQARSHCMTEYPVASYLDHKRAYRGFCEDSLVLALYLMDQGYDWMAGIQKILSLGGDTDSNGAIFGQLYGLAHPDDMMSHYVPHRCDIHRADEIDVLIEQLVEQYLVPHRDRRHTFQIAQDLKRGESQARRDGQHYDLRCYDCRHYGEGCLLGYPVNQLDYFRRSKAGRIKVAQIRSDDFRRTWTTKRGRNPSRIDCPPCYVSA